jgi:hypothetical protein
MLQLSWCNSGVSERVLTPWATEFAGFCKVVRRPNIGAKPQKSVFQLIWPKPMQICRLHITG